MVEPAVLAMMGAAARRKRPGTGPARARSAPTPAATPAAPSHKSSTFTSRLKPNQTHDQATAEMMVDGLGMNAVTAVAYSPTLGELDLTECMATLTRETQKVQEGHLGGLEALLTAQAVTLNAMFTKLAYQAARMTIVDQIDRFTRLALKAQTQCRATCETLAVIKNPPTVFARQANFAQGPQQVNNNTALPAVDGSRARGALASAPIELLEGDVERMDGDATPAAGAGDPALAAVGAVHRSAKR